MTVDIEDAIISALKKTKTRHPLLLGIGDDAAVVPASLPICLTKDLLVEGTHFSWDYYSVADLAYKSLAVNVSDCISMGVRPEYVLLGLGLPGGTPAARRNRFIRHFKKYLTAFKLTLIGGDTVRSDRWLLSVTMLGRGRRFITRGSARINDRIYLTGFPGLSRLGLERLQKGKPYPAGSAPAIRQHLRPRIAADFILALTRRKKISAMMDVSDGLSKDLYSFIGPPVVPGARRGACLDERALPVHPLLARMPRHQRLDYLLNGGEDYGFLFSATAATEPAIKALARKHRVTVRCIGRIVDRRGVWLSQDSGVITRVKRKTYEHF